MSSQTIKKSGKVPELKLGESKVLGAKRNSSAADASLSGYTTFERKAEEMKIFLSDNPIPEEFLKKK